ncbi:MAG: hypothetical protein J6N21_08210 [Butyrivibrio sp.]|nr:hypothetical protein [Butyrivibrio sp.]
MESKRKLLYSDFEGNVKDLLAYVHQLEMERDDALEKVHKWNSEDEVFNAYVERLEMVSRVNAGFAPTEEQWDKVRSWENYHSDEMHSMPEIKEKRKYIPGMPEYRYEFVENHLGDKVGTVTCLTCARKAMRRSLGNKWLYESLCKKYDAEYCIGDI